MTCLEQYLQEHPNTDIDALLEDCYPNITGGIDIPDPKYCSPGNNELCTLCWKREIPGTEDLPPVIKDSGERRQFDTGAVRDIQEGKGRCDLMPLGVVAEYLTRDGKADQVLALLDHFQKTSNLACLRLTLDEFNEIHWGNNKTMLLEVAKHFEDGAKKYGEHNWQKGIPVRCYIDSAVRHYLKWLRGDKDEPHDRAFCWNILCAIWTCKHKPELNDYNKEETK